MRVTSTAIRAKGGNDFIVTADVTIREITRSVDFEVEFLGFNPAMDGARRAGFSAKARSSVSRSSSKSKSPSSKRSPSPRLSCPP